jgi:cytoskeletal protein CcmA (bactofilin family)
MGERERTGGGAGGVDAFLGAGTTITGTLVFDGIGRIEGRVDGEVTARDTLTIGEGSVVNATVTGTTVIVEGQVTGDVTARKRLEVRASGRVRGNIAAPTLVVHEGAVIDGQCTMRGTEVAAGAGDLEAVPILDRTRDAALEVVSTLTR